MKKLYENYRLWGADAKCQQLEKELSESIAFASHQRQFRKSSPQTEYFDLEMILSTHKVLAAQESLEDLLKKAIEIILKSARITKCLVLLRDETGEMVVKALGDQENIEYFVVEPAVIEFPETIVNYTSRVKKRIVSENVRKDLEFTFDPYWKEEHVVSVCALPMLSKNELSGIIYFENNILEGAFDSNRIEFFETVTTQLTTSLESLLLSTKIEKQVAARTIQLAQKNEALFEEKEKSDRLLKNILPSKTAEDLKNLGRTSAQLS